MKVVVLVVTTVLAASAGVGVLSLLDEPGHVLPAAAAVALCLPPAMVTLVLVGVLQRRAADAVPAAVMVATAMRMGVAVIGVLVFGELLGRAGVSRDRFSAWLVCVYLLTLVVESGLLVYGSGKPAPRPEPTGAA